MTMRMDAGFFKQDALTLARSLLGKVLVRQIDGQLYKARIVETEAYIGPEDKGSHAFNNRRTKRTEVMFWEGGHAYIYLIYGMYYCFNIVANQADKPEAVLIRGLEPLNHLEAIRRNRPIKSRKSVDLTNGPGKLCQAFRIDKSLNGYNMVEGDLLYLEEGTEPHHIQTTPRINIDYAAEYRDVPWRFIIVGNPYVSK